MSWSEREGLDFISVELPCECMLLGKISCKDGSARKFWYDGEYELLNESAVPKLLAKHHRDVPSWVQWFVYLMNYLEKGWSFTRRK